MTEFYSAQWERPLKVQCMNILYLYLYFSMILKSDELHRVLYTDNIYVTKNRLQWRIQDFPQGGVPTSKIAIIFQIFAENCMKMKEFGPPGGTHRWRHPLDPSMD